ncbi:30S ribosome-binding factor RbfA [Rhabdobacter roseus]|uniref:Ribosome-binding factor A n=1 Tax=Rhabdobacter roseus TaxID=1655419 RepID=A0A840TTY3_9BACT|nr:30S ribosome-binding factor RbfA [Rhabdobacter roseus]MBB5286365.1 ribosome-binding factor A [Rhabdobacter roseus]
MESKRQQKVGRQIQKDLGELFQREARHVINGAFVTVTAVRMTPDLGIARVYLSFLPDKNRKFLIEAVQENTRFIRTKLGERVRHQLRIVPELQFYLDDTAEYAAKMEALFADLVIPPAPEEDEEDNHTP